MTAPMGTAIVTGAGQRIGRAIAVSLSKQGYAVAIHCHRSTVQAEELATAIRAEGRQAAVICTDLTDLPALPRLITTARETLGPLSLLVNNASLFEKDYAASLDPAVFDRHFAINLRAPVFLSTAFFQQVPKNEQAAIVNIIDQRVLKLTPQFFSYTLAKSALWTATKTMAQAFAPHVRVNAIGPGPTLRNERQSTADFHRQSRVIPLAQAVAPEDIAEAVRFLATARSVTGQLLAVDGGQHLTWQTVDAFGIAE
jgi:NAD(P)-dependent dehydrogenase (short-subunit alcohol dehydrogenase family)